MNDIDQTPVPQRPSRAPLYTSIAAAGIGATALVAALVIGVTGVSNAHEIHVDRGTTHTVVIPVQPDNGNGTHTTGGGSSTVTPSATIRLLQQQLAQLNYYEGPINGIDSPQVHQAIQYLQRDAHLPQTGVLTPATQTALSRMLVDGNSQMGG